MDGDYDYGRVCWPEEVTRSSTDPGQHTDHDEARSISSSSTAAVRASEATVLIYASGRVSIMLHNVAHGLLGN